MHIIIYIISGLSEELKLFHKEKLDHLLKHFLNIIKARIGADFYEFISYKAIKIQGETIIEVSTKAIKYGNGCFLDGKEFIVRQNPGNVVLSGKEMIKYWKEHFTSRP